MKLLSTLKFFGYTSVILFATQTHAADVVTTSAQKTAAALAKVTETKAKEINLKSDKEIVSTALKDIKEFLNKGDGKPTKVLCTYIMDGAKAISADLKKHFGLSYRKKAASIHKSFVEDAAHSHFTSKRIITITYNTNDKGSVQLREKGSNGKRKVEIEIPEVQRL